ncbi:MAG TPA: glycosyltransferase family 1 protein [Anaerolineae bacterium]|nr:glycosyltransferase family 1 protein [Anaerolineae bacterium]
MPLEKAGQMRVLVVAHKQHFLVDGLYCTVGGTAPEYHALYQAFGDLRILGCLRRAESPPQGVEWLPTGVRVHQVAPRIFWRAYLPQLLGIKAALQTVYLVRRHRIDMVIGKAPMEVGFGGVIGAKLAGVPSLLRLVGDWLTPASSGKPRLPERTLRYRRRLMLLAARCSDRVAAVSTAIAESLLALGVPQQEIVKPFPNPFVETFFDVPAWSVVSARKTLLYSGRLVEGKNVERLLEAFRILLGRLEPDRWPELKIVGDGYLRPKLEQQAVKMGLAGQVKFVGPVPHERVPDHLIDSYAVVQPSLSEGMSKAILEAMAAGRPVAASAVGGNPELVEDGVTGYLFDPYDTVDMANVLERLLSDEARAVTMGLNGRVRARAYDGEAFGRRMLELATEILNRRKGSSHEGMSA